MVSAKARIREAYAQCAQAIVMGTVSLERAEDAGFSVHSPVFPVSQAASLAHVHPQTLREYDRAGLVQPMRTPGGARRYSISDIDRLNQAQKLSQQAIGIAGIALILDLREENRELRRELRRLKRPQGGSVFAADSAGHVREFRVDFPARGGRAGWRRALYGEVYQMESRHALRKLALETHHQEIRQIEAPRDDAQR